MSGGAWWFMDRVLTMNGIWRFGKIATAGQNGQFRTPRHIIRLMVDMTAPAPKDVICDPACGTAASSSRPEHLVGTTAEDRIYKNDGIAAVRSDEGMFHGYDFDTTDAAHRQHEGAMLLPAWRIRDIRSTHGSPRLAGRRDREWRRAVGFSRWSLGSTPPSGYGQGARAAAASSLQSALCGQSRLRVHRQGPAAASDEEDRAMARS